MTSGERAERIAGALVSILCAWVLAASPPVFAQLAPSSELGLAELMQALSAVPAVDGKFTERKYLSLLDEPLVLRGRVFSVETLEVNGDRSVMTLDASSE